MKKIFALCLVMLFVMSTPAKGEQVFTITQPDPKDQLKTFVGPLNGFELKDYRTEEDEKAGAPSMIDQVFKRQPVKSSNKPKSMEAARKVFEQCNNQKYASDKEVWGKDDYWATPKEYISKGKGDCEDFAICMYYGLRAEGWGKDQVNIWSGYVILGKDKGYAHAATVFELDGEEYYTAVSVPQLIKARDRMYKIFLPAQRINEDGWTIF